MMDRRGTVFRLSVGYEHFLQGYKAAKSPATYSEFLQGLRGQRTGSTYTSLFDNIVAAPSHETKRADSARSSRFFSMRAERSLYLTPRTPRDSRPPAKEVSWDKIDWQPPAKEDSCDKRASVAPNQITTLKWRNAAALALDNRVHKGVVFVDQPEVTTIPAVSPKHGTSPEMSVRRTEAGISDLRRPSRANRTTHANYTWDNVFNRVYDNSVWKGPKNQEAMQRKKRDACNSIRMLIFGCLLNENLSMREQNKIYEETCGTKAQVKKLWDLWRRVDTDGSGDVDLNEFMKFFSTNKSDRLLSWRAVQYLVHNGRTATIEDFMKLAWPRAEEEHIAIMIQYFRESAADGQRVPSPRLISRKTRKELRETFRDLDSDKSQHISFDEMVEAELVDKDTANALIKQFDKNGDGCIDEREFMEMMAPNGRIAFTDQRECIDVNGDFIEYIDNPWFQGWRIKDSPSLPFDYLHD